MTNPRVPFRMSSSRRTLSPPDSKPLIVHNVVNVEYWPFDQGMPRKVLSTPHDNAPVPDIPNYCWAEYGLRCGLPRLLELYAGFGLPVSVNINAAAIEHYPAAAEAMLAADWEFVGHGYEQRLLNRETDEAGVIARSLDLLEAFTGKRPRGWMGPGFAQTFDTPDLLKAAGIDYNMDWVLDEVPCWMRTRHGPMICMPYGFELNDSLLFPVERHSSRELLDRFEDTLETFDRELDRQVRVLTLAVHPHQIGVPHRIGYLRRVLERLMQRSDTIFLTGSAIADWYAAEESPAEVGVE